METRELVDWAAEAGLADRPVDDWTAGDDLDFAVAVPRRRRISDAKAPHVAPQHHAPAPASVPAAASAPAPQRRTVAITGRPGAPREVPRLREVERRRPTRTPAERAASRPDRIAMWAVAMGFVLIVIASFSG